MKRTALLLLLGLALLPHAVLADQVPVPVCVNALEQFEALKTVAPVYKLTGSQERQYLADTDRPAEIARLKTIVAGSCSAKPKHRQREESEAEQLHLVRSPVMHQFPRSAILVSRQRSSARSVASSFKSALTCSRVSASARSRTRAAISQSISRSSTECARMSVPRRNSSTRGLSDLARY